VGGRDNDGRTVAAGVYYVHFEAGSVRTTKVITYLK